MYVIFFFLFFLNSVFKQEYYTGSIIIKEKVSCILVTKNTRTHTRVENQLTHRPLLYLGSNVSQCINLPPNARILLKYGLGFGFKFEIDKTPIYRRTYIPNKF